MRTMGMILVAALTWNLGLSQDNNSVTNESVEKTYKVVANGKVIKNSVRVSTEVSNNILADNNAMEEMSKEGKSPMTKVTKTVKIDNDSDDAYEEMIRFSYHSDVQTDFTLLSNDEELVIAIDNGENLSIVENAEIDKSGITERKEAYVFTSDKGEEVSFYIERYEAM